MGRLPLFQKLGGNVMKRKKSGYVCSVTFVIVLPLREDGEITFFFVQGTWCLLGQWSNVEKMTKRKDGYVGCSHDDHRLPHT